MQTLKELVPYFFALDHPNYARWMSVHIHDLQSLPESVLQEFSNGNWVISKTKKRASSIAFDQAHEQNNRSIKAAGGLKGLTGPENEKALNRWKVIAPDLTRIKIEFENQVCPDLEEDEEQFHHQEGLSAQTRFQTQVQSLVTVIELKGNPYLDNFPELVTLDTRKVLDSSVSEALRNLKSIGDEGYNKFRKNVLIDRIMNIDDPIKRNNLPLPKNPRLTIKSKHSEKVRHLQNNVELFAQLYLSHRETDRDEFFSHESGPFPPSITENGKMYFSPSKADLLKCFELQGKETEEPPKTFDCVVLDGAAIVHFLSPSKSDKTFQDYSLKRYIPYLEGLLKYCDRIDLVFDRYLAKSLKDAVRDKRGSGTRFKVQANGKLPVRWSDFLFVSENKKELFHFLAKEIHGHSFKENKQILVTMDTKVLAVNSPAMPPCSHEEADSRIFIHILDALEEGNNCFMIRTVDTDIVTISLGKFHDIEARYSDFDLWIKFGSGQSLRMIHINSICNQIGRPTARSLPFFHAFTGCDTTSAFKGKGKKSGWQTWKAFQAITPVFEFLSQNPFSALSKESVEFMQLQKFVVLLYSKNTEAVTVNEGRKLIFASNQNLDKIPPTEDALLQHANRAIYQTGKLLI